MRRPSHTRAIAGIAAFATAVAVSAVAWPLRAAPPAAAGMAAQASLAGYLELTVEVAGLPRTAHEAGVQRSELKAQVERALRRAGVRVLTRDDMPETVGPVPTLVLTLHMLKDSSLNGIAFSYHARLACTRPALTRENGREVTGVLWEQEAMQSAQRVLIHASLKEALNGLLDAFLNEWRAANPREP